MTRVFGCYYGITYCRYRANGSLGEDKLIGIRSKVGLEGENSRTYTYYRLYPSLCFPADVFNGGDIPGHIFLPPEAFVNTSWSSLVSYFG